MVCPRDSSAKSVTQRASWRSLAVACRWSRRVRISHLSPLAFQVATCRFDTTLIPYSNYAGEGKWLPMGVALSNLNVRSKPNFVEHAFHGFNLSFDGAIRLRVVRAEWYLVDAPLVS